MRSPTSAGLLLISLLAFGSCTNLFSPSLNGTWHITKIETAPNDTESESIYRDGFLSFYEKGALSFFNKNEHDKSLGKPVYREGTWERNEGNLKISVNKTMILATFKILELSDKWLVIEITEGEKDMKGTILKCQRSDLYRSNSFDLLSPTNNEWRKRPVQKENQAHIQKRAAGHVSFLIGYFNMVEEKSQDYFETSILQTPFRFYSNGIALPEHFEMDDVWASNFYDEEDAAKGAKMLEQALTSIEVYPADSKSYSKSYYNALVLVKEFIGK